MAKQFPRLALPSGYHAPEFSSITHFGTRNLLKWLRTTSLGAQHARRFEISMRNVRHEQTREKH